MFGIQSFVAVINPPQAAILAVGAMAPTPVVRDGEVVVRNIMRLTLACDHRILYGADAAEFLGRIRERLGTRSSSRSSTGRSPARASRRPIAPTPSTTSTTSSTGARTGSGAASTTGATASRVCRTTRVTIRGFSPVAGGGAGAAGPEPPPAPSPVVPDRSSVGGASLAGDGATGIVPRRRGVRARRRGGARRSATAGAASLATGGPGVEVCAAAVRPPDGHVAGIRIGGVVDRPAHGEEAREEGSGAQRGRDERSAGAQAGHESAQVHGSTVTVSDHSENRTYVHAKLDEGSGRTA